MRENVCKKCRKIGEKLFLKGERCFSQKCAMIKRAYPPGLHGKSKKRISEYGRQLAEKQRVKFLYGISEKQFRNYIKKAAKKKGDKESLLLSQLESRLDNSVFRLGLAKSRALARQLVSHGHIFVNQRKVDIPSFQVKKGDTIKVKERSQKLAPFQSIQTELKKYKPPVWLSLDREKFEGQVINQPELEDKSQAGDIGIIIEFYSR